MQGKNLWLITILLVIAILFSALAVADETHPPGSVTGLGETSVSSTSITWSWINPSDNDSSHTEIYINDVFMVNVSAPGSSYTATGLDESTLYQIGTRTVDTYGNINTNWVNDTAITLDLTSPVINSIVLSTYTPDTGDPITVTVDVSDNVDVTSVIADGTIPLTDQGSNIWTGSITAVEGTHSVSIVASDAAGNSASSTSPSYTATTPDTTDPVINSIVLSTYTPNTGDPITVTVDVSDNVDVTSVIADGTIPLTDQGSNIWTGSITAVEGTHSVSIVASDAAGNSASSTSPSYTATTPDTTDPVINSIGLSTYTPNTGDPITVTVDVSDNVDVTSVIADGTIPLTDQGSNIWTGSITAVEGTHSVSIVASDAAGNSASSTSPSYTATTPDTTDPVINSIVLSTYTPNTGDPITVTVDVSDNVDVTSVIADGTIPLTDQGSNIWTGSITAVEGTHSVSIVASDAAGNSASSTSPSYTATTPDTTDPVINSIVLSTYTPNTGDPITVTVDVSDNVDVTSVIADGTIPLTDQGSNIWTGSITAVEGTHSVSIVASDAAGNSASSTSPSYTATTPDTTDPVINSIVLSTYTPNTGDPITVTVDVSDNVDVTSVIADGTIPLTDQGSNIWTGSITAVEGTHSVSIVASDAAGNSASSTSPSYTATTPDTTDPVINSIVLSTYTPDTGDPITVTVDVSDNVDVTSVIADGTIPLTDQGSNIWTGSITAVEGTHSVSIVASDAAGNSASSTSPSYTATTPDTTDPVINSIGLSTYTPNTGDPITVTVDVSDNVDVTSVIADGTIPLTDQGSNIWTGSITAVEGTHSVSIVASDAAGNSASSTSPSYTATTPDTTDPVINSIGLSTYTPNTGDPITVTVDVSDNVDVTSVIADGTIPLTDQGSNIWTGSITAVEGTHTVSIVASDAAGNSASATSPSYTATNPDLTPPSSVTGLAESSTNSRSIAWSWTNPSDSDFSHTMIYLDGVFMTNVSTPGNTYLASPLSESTTYQISTRTVDTNGNINTNWVSDTATTLDRSAPSSVTGLAESSVTVSSITWSWNNPSDSDFSHTMIYLDGVFMTNVSTPGNTYLASGLSEATTYQISTRTVDTNGNINTNLVNDAATTLDLTPPSNVTGLADSSVTVSSITWFWTNPSDSDFSHTMIYLDGVFTTSIHAPYNSYVVTGLSEATTYQISTRTVDANGNINTNFVNDIATTLDLTPPSSVSGLRDSSVTGSSITWSWTNPSDSDFSHTRIYLDGLFLTSISAPGNSYTATGLSEFTTYQISTRTVDTSGNINTNWVNDSATTSTSKTQPSSGGSSGGGGSSTTAEAFENIDVKDVAVMYVIKDLEKSFTFNNEDIDITYINISTDLTVGDVKTIVESLKSTSSMVSTPPEGNVYKNINIWVGDEGLKSKLITSEVGFRVNRIWLEDNGVSEYSVKLSIYRSGEWYVLNTEKTDENEGYIYYETDTAGDLHSQFAIVEYIESEPVSLDSGEETVPEGSNVPEPITEEPALALEGDAGIVASESERITGSGLNVMFFAIPVLMVLILLSASYVGVTKVYHAKARDSAFDLRDETEVTENYVSETVSDSTNVQERSGPSAETITPVQVNEPHQVDIEQKLKKLEESGILSDVVHKNKK